MTNYIVENKDMLPLKDMSDEDKLKIVNALIDDATNVEVLCWDGEWHHFDGSVASSVGLGYQYRLKAKATPLNIPWEHIKSKYKWTAMDESGSVFVYENKPVIQSDYWYNAEDIACLEDCLNINTDNVNWELSLTKRPSSLSELCK